MTKQKKRRYAKYPSCFGKLDIHGIYDTAIKHGMEVIRCQKPNMCCWYSVALYGTSSQMKNVEEEWNDSGHKTEHRKPKGAWPVRTAGSRSEWASVGIRAAKANKISNRGGTTKARIAGKDIKIPPGYRPLTQRELPRKSDIAYNYGARQFEPIEWDSVLKTGKKEFKKRAHFIARLEDKQQ